MEHLVSDAMKKPAEMSLEQAIESVKKSLAKGDEIMGSQTWSGGNFKSLAIRVLLAAVEGKV